jgi:hypothetical protein
MAAILYRYVLAYDGVVSKGRLINIRGAIGVFQR